MMGRVVIITSSRTRIGCRGNGWLFAWERFRRVSRGRRSFPYGSFFIDVTDLVKRSGTRMWSWCSKRVKGVDTSSLLHLIQCTSKCTQDSKLNVFHFEWVSQCIIRQPGMVRFESHWSKLIDWVSESVSSRFKCRTGWGRDVCWVKIKASKRRNKKRFKSKSRGVSLCVSRCKSCSKRQEEEGEKYVCFERRSQAIPSQETRQDTRMCNV